MLQRTLLLATANAPMTILETERLRLRHFTLEDAAFILDLFNQPSFIANVADRGLRSIGDARDYLRDRLMTAYTEPGFGFWAVDALDTGLTMGLCGLIRRDALDDVDIGYGFLPAFWGQGFAREAVVATVAHARDTLRLERIVAIVSPSNASSIKLLKLVGMRLETELTMPDETEPVHLYGVWLSDTETTAHDEAP